MTWIHFEQKTFWWIKLPGSFKQEIEWVDLKSRSFSIKNMLEVFMSEKDSRSKVTIEQNYSSYKLSSRLNHNERKAENGGENSLVQITANENAAIIKITDEAA